MFTRQRLHIREKKRKIKSENRVMFARVEKASFLEPCAESRRKERGEKRKYHFPYLHVFQIIQNGGKYYIIVNNQSIINHEGIRQTYRQAWWKHIQKITNSTENEMKKEDRVRKSRVARWESFW
jgi:hypothetical protein